MLYGFQATWGIQMEVFQPTALAEVMTPAPRHHLIATAKQTLSRKDEAEPNQMLEP